MPKRPPETPTAPRSRIFASIATVFVVALIIKTFVLEMHYVPTESMEPTIIGRNSGGDRVLVAKQLMGGASLERFDLVVFRYPLSRRVRFVKRIAGLPGELLTIRGGDLWTQAREQDPLRIARKPAALQARIFDANPVFDGERPGQVGAEGLRRHFLLGTGAPVRFEGDAITISGGKRSVRIALRDAPTAVRSDPFAPSRGERRDEALKRFQVGDLRLQVQVRGDAESAFLELRDGVLPRRPMRLRLTNGALELLFGGQRIASPKLDGLRLEPGDWYSLVLENADDTIRVRVDGELLLEHRYDHEDLELSGAEIAFGVEQGTAHMRAPRVARDLHWVASTEGLTRRSPRTFKIPSQHYLLLGDNSANSEDGRGWRVVGIRIRATGEVRLGDLRGLDDEQLTSATPGEHRSILPRTNPRLSGPDFRPGEDATQRGDEPHIFRDIQGNLIQLTPGSWDLLDLRAFGSAGSPDILAWHGRILSDPHVEEGHIAIPEVSSSMLAGLSHGGLTTAAFALPMHFVHERDLLGRPILAVRRAPDSGGWLPALTILR